MLFKENDIRPKDLMDAKKSLLEEDINFLRNRMAEFVPVLCPACDSNNAELWGEKLDFQYQLCKDCSTVYMSPRASQALMHEFYAQSKNYDFWNKYIFPASENVRREKIFRPRAQKVVEYCQKFGIEGNTILEIGSAFGTFCECIRDTNFFTRIIAVEPTPALAETCRRKGFEVYDAPVEELRLPHSSVDVVVNFEVIEHLFAPGAFLKQSVSFLKKGGLFICTCPNIEALGTLVLKEKAKVVDHEHVNYFNPRSISLLFARAGLEVVDVCTPGELDVDLLRNALQDDSGLQEQNPFFAFLLFRNDASALTAFQEFLKKHNLSSHMWIVGRKV